MEIIEEGEVKVGEQGISMHLEIQNLSAKRGEKRRMKRRKLRRREEEREKKNGRGGEDRRGGE